VDLDHFVVDAFEVENLAHLRAVGTGQELVELCGHGERPSRRESLRSTSSRSVSWSDGRTKSAAANASADAVLQTASTFIPARCAASMPAAVSSITSVCSGMTGSR